MFHWFDNQVNDVIHLLDVEDIDYVDSSNVTVMQSASSQATLFLFVYGKGGE